MTEQVLLTIQGKQVLENETADMPELITTGTYSLDDNVHQVIYEEQLSGDDQVTVNRLSFYDGKVELKKDGEVHMHMLFEKGKKNLSFYNTPYGAVAVEMDAREVEVHTSGEQIQIRLEYGLTMNEVHSVDCALSIDIRPIEA